VNDGAVATATVDGAEVRGSDYAESKRGCCSSSGRRQFVQVRAAIAEKNVAGRTHIDHRGREVVRPWGDRSAADRAPARSRAGYRSVKGEICCARGGNGLYPIDGSGFTRSAAAGGYPERVTSSPILSELATVTVTTVVVAVIAVGLSDAGEALTWTGKFPPPYAGVPLNVGVIEYR